MCNDQLSAITPTHGEYTASLIFPSTVGGAVKFPPVKPTGVISKPPLGELPTTLATDTVPSPTPSFLFSTSSLIPELTPSGHSSPFIATTRFPTTQTSATTLSTVTGTVIVSPPVETDGTDNGNEDRSSITFSPSQIAGISIGVAAVAAVALGAILLARHCRRRKYPNVKTGFLSRRSTLGPYICNLDSNQSSESWFGTQMRAEHHVTSLPPPPRYLRKSYNRPRKSYNRTSWRSDAIGLAIDSTLPRQDEEKVLTPRSQTHRLSKLLPAKPDLPSIFKRFSKVDTKSSDHKFQPTHYQETQQTDRQQALPPIFASFTKPFELPSTPVRRLTLHHESHHREVQQLQPQKARIITVQKSPGLPKDKPKPLPLKLEIPQSQRKSLLPDTTGSCSTEFEEEYALSPEGQVWKHPSSATTSAAPTYVADKNGNWILAASEKGSVLSPCYPDLKSDGVSDPSSSGSGPAPSDYVSAESSSGTGPFRAQIPLKASLATANNLHISNKNYTKRHSMYAQQSSMPPPLFSMNQPATRQSSAPANLLGRSLTDNRTSPPDSDITTLFEGTSSEDITPPEVQNILSPVPESPGLTTGRFLSINPGRASRMTQGFMPPPRRTKGYYPPGQPSPTLGPYHPHCSTQGMSSLNVPIRVRRPTEPPGQVRSGSPLTMRVVKPSPEPDDRCHLPSIRSSHSPSLTNPWSPYRQHDHPGLKDVPLLLPDGSTPQQYPYCRPVKSTQRSQYEQYRQGVRSPPRQPLHRGLPLNPHPHHRQGLPRNTPPLHHQGLPSHPHPHYNNQGLPPNPRPPPQQQSYLDPQASPNLQPETDDYKSPNPEHALSFNNSVLLAKRLGNDRAAQMALHAKKSDLSDSKWHRDRLPSPDQAKDEIYELPATPGWLPRLTPVRQGDDLVLNVQ